MERKLQLSRKDHVTKESDRVTCTKGTTICTRNVTVRLPTQVRKLSWTALKFKDEKVCLGKGVFGKCYCVRIGPINACLKIFRSKSKYANTFFNEIRMLMQVSHENIPWLYGMCYDAKHPRAIAMTYHPFCGGSESATVHAALKTSKFHDKVSQVD